MRPEKSVCPIIFSLKKVLAPLSFGLGPSIRICKDRRGGELPGGGTPLHMCSDARTKHSERYPKRVAATFIKFDPSKLVKSP